MPHWEYLFISCAFENDAWRPAFANGKAVPGWQTTTVYDYSNGLGAEGWELVNLAATDRAAETDPRFYAEQPLRSEQTFRLVFKRPKP